MKGIAYFLFVYCLISLPSIQSGLSQVYCRINGSIITKEKDIPIPNASILIRKPGADRIISFTLTNHKGEFNINKLLHPGNYLLLITHISYETEIITLTIDSANKIYMGLVFRLLPKAHELKDVVVHSTPSGISTKGDTIEYVAKGYQTPEVNKLEDLLRNMQGFTIDANGNISYNGKQVEKVLIEGEDLADRAYKLISKNLNATFIDKVQVISNYNDDRLLRNIEQSGKVGINLKISEKWLNKISLSGEIGYSPNGRKAANQNSIYLTGKIKFLSLTNYNNIGNSSTTDIGYYYQQDESNQNKIVQEGDNSNGLIQTGNLLLPDLDDSYKRNNKEISSCIMSSWKFGHSIKMKSMLGFTKSNVINSGNSFSETLITPINKWAIQSDQNAGFVNNNSFARISLQHDNGRKNLGSYNVYLTQANQDNSYSNISHLSIVDSLKESLLNKLFNIKLSGSETYKNKNNSILKIELNFTKERSIQNFNTQTNRFIKYFNIDSTYLFNTQNLVNHSQRVNLTFRWLRKLSTVSYQYGIQFREDHNRYTTDLINTSAIVSRPTIINPTDSAKYSNDRIGFFGLITKKIGRYNIITLGGSSGLSHLSIKNRILNEERYPFYFRYFFEYRKNITEFKTFQFQYQLEKSMPEEENFHPSFLISGNASVLQTSTQIRFPLSNQIRLVYLSNNILKGTQLLLSISHSTDFNSNTVSSYFSPEYSAYMMLPGEKSMLTTVNVNSEKYIKPLKSKVKIECQGMLAKRNIFINSVLKDNIYNSAGTQIKWITAFPLPVNIELSARGSYFENYTAGQTTKKNKLWQYQGYGKVKINFSQRFYSSIFYNYYVLTTNNSFKKVDMYAVFKASKKCSISITVHNLLNTSKIEQKTISATSIDINEFQLIQRYFLGKISFSF